MNKYNQTEKKILKNYPDKNFNNIGRSENIFGQLLTNPGHTHPLFEVTKAPNDNNIIGLSTEFDHEVFNKGGKRKTKRRKKGGKRKKSIKHKRKSNKRKSKKRKPKKAGGPCLSIESIPQAKPDRHYPTANNVRRIDQNGPFFNLERNIYTEAPAVIKPYDNPTVVIVPKK